MYKPWAYTRTQGFLVDLYTLGAYTQGGLYTRKKIGIFRKKNVSTQWVIFIQIIDFWRLFASFSWKTTAKQLKYFVLESFMLCIRLCTHRKGWEGLSINAHSFNWTTYWCAENMEYTIKIIQIRVQNHFLACIWKCRKKTSACTGHTLQTGSQADTTLRLHRPLILKPLMCHTWPYELNNSMKYFLE